MNKQRNVKRRWPAAWVPGALVLTGLAAAAPGVIETEYLIIEERSTPEANVIVVSEVQRNGDDVTPVGLPRIYTERKQ